MAPSGLKKASSFRAVELALQGQCELDRKVVRLASQERVQQRPLPECSSERFDELNEIVELTKKLEQEPNLGAYRGSESQGFRTGGQGSTAFG